MANDEIRNECAARSQQIAFIALGSNLGDSRGNVLAAISRLEALSHQPLLRSSLWETQPEACPPGSPNFINCVVGLVPRSNETPENLLRELHRLEQEFGRQPKQVLNEPRPLDLDLIAFGAEVRHTLELILPHPRATGRRFVLGPLAEIAPDFVFPGQTKTVAQLLASLC
jgi:2-amino-4-hydroxy-6-hydroxymethyldihydropteridine diphosphokinase